ncbi:MAG: acetyl-coenzyme A synthetase, partial [Bryobacteraceae bacterium]|nr:acetyl-coenzyme A synthetase [Bryobacteraceae bacterium]
MQELSLYPPSPELSARAHVPDVDAYQALRRRAAEHPEEFWAEMAEKEVHWFEKWHHVFEGPPPFVKWFVGAKTNASYNCLDRHMA